MFRWSICLFLWPGLAVLDTVPEPLTEFAQGLTTYQASFQQTVTDDRGRLLERAAGTLALKSPDRLRWHYLEDFEQLIVADGHKVWLHDIELEQITVRDQTQAAASSPLYALSNPSELSRHYELQSRSEVDGQARIRLIPRSPEAEFEWVELGFQGDRLYLLMIRDGLGQVTEIRFSEVIRNAPLADALFVFVPPPGVDVLSSEEVAVPSVESSP